MTVPEEIKKEIEKFDGLLESLRATLQGSDLDTASAPILAKKAELEARLVGSGAIAQGDGATAIGERGVLVNGDGNTVNTGDTHYHIDDPSRASPDELKIAYLNHLYKNTSQLALAGIDRHTARDAEAKISLASVYTALRVIGSFDDAPIEEVKEEYKLSDQDIQKAKQNGFYTVGDLRRRSKVTLSSFEAALSLFEQADADSLNNIFGEYNETHQREANYRPSVISQLNGRRHLVLLGDPGSGKTTFVNFVALCLSSEVLGKQPGIAALKKPLPQDEDGNRKKGDQQPPPQPWDHGALLPVRVILRDFAARGLPKIGEKASAKHLWDFIAAELEPCSLADYTPILRKHLLESGGLLMLDGLDEVPEAEQRRVQIKDVVEDFAAVHPRCRVLVTSRTYAYQKQDWQLDGFHESVLAPFSHGQIEQFVDRWYDHFAVIRGLAEDDAKGRAAILKRAIFTSDRLQGFAERPLLLTLMASLHAWRGGTLPDKREELYADTVDLLLDWWENQRIVRDADGEVRLIQPSLAEWLKVDRKKVRSLLNELAYNAHAAQPDLTGTADIAEADLVAGLMRLSQNPDVKPKRLVEFLTARAGLLLPRGIGIYTFPHRTFQEYLAACHLTDHGYPDAVAKLAREDPNRWREVCLLAGAKATGGGAFALWPLVDALCGSEPSDLARETDFWGALLAGQALTENLNDDELSEVNQAKQKRVCNWLVSTVETNVLPTVELMLAGNTLATLGDPRFDENTWWLPSGDTLGFLHVPAGKFLMGSNDNDKAAQSREKPQHEVELPGFWMAKYPVTVDQFRVFINEGGYRFDRWGNNPTGNHPIVAVSWHDALSYCSWLDQKLKQVSEQRSELAKEAEAVEFWQGLVDGRLHLTLPSEAEWEKAARGSDGRLYPWGDDFSPGLANVYESGQGTTSSVGAFSVDISPFGIHDMGGNVREWTRSLWGKDFSNPEYEYPYFLGDVSRENLDADDRVRRVIRGGSFDDLAESARCAYRYRHSPNFRYYYLGFRVVVSPLGGSPPA